MNKIISIALMLMLSATIAVAQKGAKFQFKEKDNTFDFGKVTEGEVVTHEYEFKNTGDQPLQILKAEASCGCTTPDWPKSPIMPGKTGKIKVSFDSNGRVGVTSKQIFIKSNAVLDDPASDRLELKLIGTVLEKKS